MVHAASFLQGSSSHAKNWSCKLISSRNLNEWILKSSTTVTYESSIKAFQKSYNFTFYSPFALSKKSGWPNKAMWFLLKGLNDLGPAHFSHIDCYLIDFTEKYGLLFSKLNEVKLKKNLSRQRAI